jgi:predicted oxidoreductase
VASSICGKVIVVEKEPVFGGATAWSGGWMWVPGNPLARRAGIHEDPEGPRGSFGTFAGLKTDEHTRVLDREGRPIPQLHAVGADMASVMGGYYPSGGINLGPAMTFGYIAGRRIAGATDDDAATTICHRGVEGNHARADRDEIPASEKPPRA